MTVSIMGFESDDRSSYLDATFGSSFAFASRVSDLKELISPLFLSNTPFRRNDIFIQLQGVRVIFQSEGVLKPSFNASF